ncbi:MAG: glycosyltransferase [Bacteroidaceae bacterium]|nr:glycosyltransferase [Bacteroidaceae bacterium]
MGTLSILIPAYNWDCSQLISDLHAQGEALGIEYEIIVADDHSGNDDTLQAISRTAQALERCRLIALGQNIGRSAIRNLLADNAVYDKLLFMDCDAEVCSDTFLKDYLTAAAKADVVCGSERHPDKLPCPGVELRWKYERKADTRRSAGHRSRTPYARFSSFAFLISRELFQSIRFDTSFIGYGYEDVVFGMELERHGVSVLHIDNPLFKPEADDNATFLAKTEESMRTLLAHKELIGGGSSLLTHYSRIERLHLTFLLGMLSPFMPLIRRNLLGHHPSLVLFSLYKLLYINSIKS